MRRIRGRSHASLLVPEGAIYLVDGQPFNHSTSVIWPTGSKHTLSVPALTQIRLAVRTQYNFINW